MTIFVLIFGILALAFGIAILVRPRVIRIYFSLCKKNNYLKIGGLIAIPVGIIFLMAASECRITWLVTFLGIWSIIKGVLLLAINKETLFAYIDWWQEKSLIILRLLGGATIALGALIIYSS